MKATNAKVVNLCNDALHKFSRGLVNRCGVIIVGDVNAIHSPELKAPSRSMTPAGLC